MQTSSTRLAIVTGPNTPDLTEDGRALRETLRERGVRAEGVVWTDDSVDWTAFDAALVRSCFRYYRRPDAFADWLDALAEADVRVFNPPSVVRWNLHKFYLRDLADAGVPVLSTAFVEQGTGRDLRALLTERGWDDAVVKPAVGTSSDGVWRTSLPGATGDQERFAAELAEGDLLVQRFAPEVVDGERALVFFAGEYSHASRSIPADGEFRSHPDFGGSNEPYDPPEAVVEKAGAVLDAAGDVLDVDPAGLPYARVDGVERDGDFRLMELELIEPYLGHARQDSTGRFADAVLDALDAPTR